VDERMRFLARLLKGAAMSEICRELGISRKTGHKIFDRYKEHGLEALSDRSRRPVGYDLGFIDQEPKTLPTLDNPFGPRASPIS
jgi:transposase-like protein